MNHDCVIEASGLSKRFNRQVALDNVSFKIPKGRIVGLIGPNGAGKTTLLKSILGMTDIAGDLNVLGMSPKRQRAQLIEQVSFIADTAILPKWIKVCQLVEYMVGVHPKFDRQKAEFFLSTTKIQPQQKVAELSKGMVTQLHLALIMAIDSQLLVLDEPTLGLDLMYRKQFYSTLLSDFYDGEKTVLITTHQVEEVEHILTDVIFMDDGQIVVDCSVESLQQNYIRVFATAEEKAQLQQLGVRVLDEQPRLGGLTLILDCATLPSGNPIVANGIVPSVAEIFVATISARRAGALQ